MFEVFLNDESIKVFNTEKEASAYCQGIKDSINDIIDTHSKRLRKKTILSLLKESRNIYVKEKVAFSEGKK